MKSQGQENQGNIGIEIRKPDKKFNWPVVLIAFVIIGLAYVALSGILKMPERTTVYCQFNTTIYDSVQRDQCGYIKVISSDISKVGIHEFEKFGKCSEEIQKLPKCEGFETYHFSKYDLQDLCEEDGCKVDGVICNAFFINYHDNNNPSRQEFEQGFFLKPNMESEDKLMQLFNDCKVGGWLPWS